MSCLLDEVMKKVINFNEDGICSACVYHEEKEKGINCFLEGEDNGEWVLVDCGDIICHVMQPIIREYYNLEEIWGFKSIPLGKIKDSFQEK